MADVLHSAQLYAAALDANLASPGARPCAVDGLGAAIDTDHAARRPGDLSQLRERSDRTAPDVDQACSVAEAGSGTHLPHAVGVLLGAH